MTKNLPYRENPMLRWSYSKLAPLYDLMIARPLLEARTRSLLSLQINVAGKVLLSGIGTGLDLPLLPKMHRYTGLDFSAAMLSRARSRGDQLQGEGLQMECVLGDSMALPFADAHFDHVVLHLILAVVPQPELCLSEAARVLKPGGTIIIFDKFLRHGQPAWLRRALNPLSRRFATRMDVVFEDVLHEVGARRAVPLLRVVSDVPLLAGGWFRGIVLRKD
jgi:ubiquinone/menaquinone biosynthesis C-methylase UbiE